MSRTRLLRPVVGLIALALCLIPCASVAEMPWALAMKTDAEVLEIVGGLNAEAPGAESAAAVAILREVAWDVLPGSRLLYRNTVLKVNDTAEIADIASGFYLDARGEVEEAQAFRIRGGELTRHSVQVSAGDGQVRRARLRIDLSDLLPGDIVGVSAITRFDNILYFNKVPICTRFPVANFSLRLHVVKNHIYTMQADNFDGLNVEVVAREDARPTEWHATASGIAGVEDFHGAGPFAAGTPLVLIAESAEWVPAANDWVSTLAWSRTALFLSGMRELAISSMIGAWEKAPQVIAGATTNAEKEEAIFAFVRAELELMRGDKYDPIGHRSAAEVFESGRATPMEQAMIMVTLLAAAGLQGEIGLVRTEAWGPLDTKMQSFVQFQEVVIRCGKTSTRYYVPYVADAPVGTLPEEWGKSWVLTPAPGLTGIMAQASAEIMSNPNIDVRSSMMRMREEAKDRGWYTLHQVGGGSR